jgi:hypothetical protein
MGQQMRYQRGVPLTAEERAGGGQGAGRSWQQGNMYGGNSNVPVGAFGGAQDYGAGGGQYNLGQIMQAILAQYQPQEPPSETYTTRKMLQDPVGYYNKMASLPSNAPGSLSAFAPGGLFEGRMAADTMTPAQITASQGMNAKNQWASMGKPGTTAPGGEDVDELRRLNAQQAGRYRTYM